MSSRCSIIYDDEKHIYWEGCDGDIDFVWYALNDFDYSTKFKNKYREPSITEDELITIFKYMMEFSAFREKAKMRGIVEEKNL